MQNKMADENNQNWQTVKTLIFNSNLILKNDK